jgi:hypothetical protein
MTPTETAAVDTMPSFEDMLAIRNEEAEAEETPLGHCEHCGAAFYCVIEAAWHDAAECVGGDERFRS